MENRTRSERFQIYLSEKEMKKLTEKVKRTGLTRSAYIRKLIEDVKPVELPHPDFFEVLKALRQISINMNQIAIKANMTGAIHADAYWENSRRLQVVISDIKAMIFEAKTDKQ